MTRCRHLGPTPCFAARRQRSFWATSPWRLWLACSTRPAALPLPLRIRTESHTRTRAASHRSSASSPRSRRTYSTLSEKRWRVVRSQSFTRRQSLTRSTTCQVARSSEQLGTLRGRLVGVTERLAQARLRTSPPAPPPLRDANGMQKVVRDAERAPSCRWTTRCLRRRPRRRRSCATRAPASTTEPRPPKAAATSSLRRRGLLGSWPPWSGHGPRRRCSGSTRWRRRRQRRTCTCARSTRRAAYLRLAPTASRTRTFSTSSGLPRRRRGAHSQTPPPAPAPPPRARTVGRTPVESGGGRTGSLPAARAHKRFAKGCAPHTRARAAGASAAAARRAQGEARGEAERSPGAGAPAQCQGHTRVRPPQLTIGFARDASSIRTRNMRVKLARRPPQVGSASVDRKAKRVQRKKFMTFEEQMGLPAAGAASFSRGGAAPQQQPPPPPPLGGPPALSGGEPNPNPNPDPNPRPSSLVGGRA